LQSSSSSGISKVSVDQRRLHDEANERKDFEEERFVRLVSTDSSSTSHPLRPVTLTMIAILPHELSGAIALTTPLISSLFADDVS
jgi:hypothetical protein